ncbi:hypothetical protein B0H34DRAFT_748922 [Crassisporium funariophilum]|nr:hypothetical protein B0H34DRAFT_748922 [Crassisporium funariophilum]
MGATGTQNSSETSTLGGQDDARDDNRRQYGVRRRKNHPIPLPIPVPNLNKKSRGRKVPYVANVTAGDAALTPTPPLEGAKKEDTDTEVSFGDSRSRSTSRIRRKVAPPPSASQDAGERSFVCVVPGCGKCFVRGEHLKRHVRSIHTYDKPHPCPFEGCDKSFSRRDNLGQHVRIHLQS